MSYDLSRIDIPVIDDESTREELIRYIRILEARLEIDHMSILKEGWRLGPKGIEDIFEREELNQTERVNMLRSGLDGIGVRDIAEALRQADAAEDWDSCDDDDCDDDEGPDADTGG